MRKTIILVCSCILWVACKNVADSDKYMVRMSTPSNACRVQLKTASPIGEDHLGPFSTKNEEKSYYMEIFEIPGRNNGAEIANYGLQRFI